MSKSETIKEDLLEGADEIAAFIYGDPGKRRKVYYLIEKEGLPVLRMGGICARKSTILKWIEQRELAAASPSASAA